MRKVTFLALVLLAGCKGIKGPLDRSDRADRPDDPLYSIEEQQRRGRDRLSLPEDDHTVRPTGVDRYGPTATK